MATEPDTQFLVLMGRVVVEDDVDDLPAGMPRSRALRTRINFDADDAA